MEDTINTLVHGDCIEALKSLPDESIDCVVTDPPYGIKYVTKRRTRENSIARPVAGDTLADALSIWDAACTMLVPKLKPDAHLYVFTSWKVYPQFAEITAKYFNIKNMLVWVKNNHGAGDLYGNYAERHELIMFATNIYGRRLMRGGRIDNVLFYDKVPSSKLRHSCEKPVQLLQCLIEKSTDAGALIVDPFAGSGSTLEAAKLSGRAYWGCELDENNYRTAVDRLK